MSQIGAWRSDAWIDRAAAGEGPLGDLLGIWDDHLGYQVVVRCGERCVMGVGQHHDQGAGGQGVDLEDHQVRPSGPEHLGHLVDVAGPRTAVGGRADASTTSFVHRARQDVVDDDDAGRMAMTLGVHEVPEGELGQVHPVDERQVHHRLVEMCERLWAGEELVTGRPHQVQVAVELGLHREERVNADARHARQGQALPGPHADLEVGARLQSLVQSPQELVSSQLLPSSSGSGVSDAGDRRHLMRLTLIGPMMAPTPIATAA